MGTPFFSIIIPTRDRPEFIHVNLTALKSQTFSDFEVIVSDNPTMLDCKEAFERSGDDRFHYVRTPQALGISDNWENGIKLARGEYIIYLEDKTVMQINALQEIFDVINETAADIVNFPFEAFIMRDEKRSIQQGIVIQKKRKNYYYQFDPTEAMIEHFSFLHMNNDYTPEWTKGRVLGGAYNKKIIEKVRALNEGRVFAGFIPDHYLMILGLGLSRVAVMIEKNLCYFISSEKSTTNGVRRKGYAGFVSFAQGSVHNNDYIVHAPIQSGYYSMTNLIACDYNRAWELLVQRGICKASDELKCNRAFIALAALQDLKNVSFNTIEEKRFHENSINEFVNSLSDHEKQLIKKSKNTSMKKQAVFILRRWNLFPKGYFMVFKSMLDKRNKNCFFVNNLLDFLLFQKADK